ncbi:SpoIIE family protein phosphatase [Mycobacterium kubicae]|uniref:SpoIIE family protein phosphatase n=1 Tax=Mycobacterium kubicae TaxID=120959 RepID=UPI000A22D01F|nr:protein phosphatase [Mycobacterium kubicae]
MRAVERYQVLDAPPNRVFGRIAGLAAHVFDAPIAVVSVVGHDRIWFMGVHGLESLRQIPRDEGLCGSAVVSDTPYVVSDTLTDSRTAHNRFVEERGIRFYASAPIVSFEGHRLGVVAVMDTKVATASEKQLSILQDLAAIVMEQLELRLSSLDAVRVERRLRGAAEYARDDARRGRDAARQARDDARLDRDIAERERDLIEQYATVLQRTLLPPALPDIPGLALACLYHPASARQVGGDFYDVFALDDQRWAFFIGDVEGHGAEAAVVTSLIRYTLRSAALHISDPTEGLAQLNTVLLKEMNPRRFCTVLFGTLRSSGDGGGFEITMATGGHPPALRLDAGSGTAEKIRSSGGMLVGATPSATFDACRLHLQPGQTLLFYTDGLIEARHSRFPFGEEDLAAFARQRAAMGARGLVDDLAALIPKLEPDDDVAVLAITAR